MRWFGTFRSIFLNSFETILVIHFKFIDWFVHDKDGLKVLIVSLDSKVTKLFFTDTLQKRITSFNYECLLVGIVSIHTLDFDPMINKALIIMLKTDPLRIAELSYLMHCSCFYSE